MNFWGEATCTLGAVQRKCILLEKSNSHYAHTHTFWSGLTNPGALCSCVWQLPTLIVFGAHFSAFPQKQEICGKDFVLGQNNAKMPN